MRLFLYSPSKNIIASPKTTEGRTGCRALSLLEVLIATMIIAVTMYGMLLTLMTHRAAEEGLRQQKILRQLHYQLVREIMKGQRDQNSAQLLSANTWSLTNTAISGISNVSITDPPPSQRIFYTCTVNDDPNDSSFPQKITTELYIQKKALRTATSTLTFSQPYTAGAGWISVKP